MAGPDGMFAQKEICNPATALVAADNSASPRHCGVGIGEKINGRGW